MLIECVDKLLQIEIRTPTKENTLAMLQANLLLVSLLLWTLELDMFSVFVSKSSSNLVFSIFCE